MPEHFAQFPLDRRKVTLHVQKILPANWKAAQEAFMEAYHNFETHNAPNGANAQYDIFGKFVTRFIHNIGNYSPEALADYPGDKWRAPPLTENEVLQTLSIHGLEHEEVPPGETARPSSITCSQTCSSFRESPSRWCIASVRMAMMSTALSSI